MADKICEDEEISLLAGTLFLELQKIVARAGWEVVRERQRWVAKKRTVLLASVDKLRKDRAFLNELLNEKDFYEVIKEMKRIKRLKCQRCGYCCTIHENKYLEKDPYTRCKFMTDENLCSIYCTEVRRKICPGTSILFSTEKDLWFLVASHVFDVLKECCLVIAEFWDRMAEKKRMREGEEKMKEKKPCLNCQRPLPDRAHHFSNVCALEHGYCSFMCMMAKVGKKEAFARLNTMHYAIRG